MTNGWLSLKSWFRSNVTAELLRQLLLGVLVFALVGEFAGFIGDLHSFVAPRGIVEAHDNDSGKMVEVTERTHWWNDTGFRYYGPLYFRVAHTFEMMSPWPRLGTAVDAAEFPEESAHFSLLLTSLVGLFALAAAIALQIGGPLELQLLFVWISVPLFLQDPTWRSYLWTAHPDLLLAAFCVFGFWFLTRWLAERKFLNAACWSWAAALSTKASTLFFLPGLGVLVWLLTEDWTPNLKKILKTGLIAYLIIGFPTNLDVVGTAQTLGKVARFSDGFSWTAFIDWWHLLFLQAGPALAVAGFAALWVPAPRSRFLWPQWFAALAAIQSAFFLISLKNVELVHEHYVIPFAALTVISTVWLLRVMPWRGRFPRPQWLQPNLISFVLLTILGMFTVPPLTATWREGLAKALVCRPTYEKVYQFALGELQRGATVLATPYTPLPVRDEKHVTISWVWPQKVLAESSAPLFVMSHSYASRFLVDEASAYVQKNNPEWLESRQFFKALEASQDFTDAAHRRWHQEMTPECSLSVWKRLD